jgi:hypothetical protein
VTEASAEPPLTYEDRYVAFVDVLGFADLVSRSQSSPQIVARLHNALSQLSARARSARSQDLGLEAASFSDTVVLSAPVGDTELLRIVEIIDEFGFDLLSSSMLFRGAIVRGLVRHTPDYIFGPALVSAYRLETNISFHPRIMFDTAAFATARDDPRFERYLVADAYDVPYLNPFARWQTDEPLSGEALAGLVQLQSIIANGLMAGASNPSVGEKYKWLGRKLNRFIQSSNSRLELEPLSLD